MAKKNIPSKCSYALPQMLSRGVQVMQPDVLPSVITGSTPGTCPGGVAPVGLRDKTVGRSQKGVSRRSESR